jgi:NAD+ synthase (glutamine-hydrolysing)
MPTTAPHGFLRVAAASPRLTLADPDRNAEEIARVLCQAGARGVQLAVFPELCLTGYTAGDLFFSHDTLLGGAERALGRLLAETANEAFAFVVGLPVLLDGRLFNAAAVCQGGRLLGAVPKSYLPGYKEYYEERWFSSARDATRDHVTLAGQRTPFGPELLFSVESEPGVAIAVEICEDLWAPVQPSSRHALAGATVLLNLSASNEIVAKAEHRRQLVAQQSARLVAAYVYSSAGVHESTADTVFGGHCMIAEYGVLLEENERFSRDSTLVSADIDTQRLQVERTRLTSFADTSPLGSCAYRRISLDPIPSSLVGASGRLERVVDPHPFVPKDPATLDTRCAEVFSIQTAGLAKRLEHTDIRAITLGLSGGLDSTLALLVAVGTFDLLGWPRSGVLAVTMPGFGTSARTLDSARRLAKATNVSLREVDIRPACEQHIRDIGLDAEDRSSTTFQNLQARERTQVLMDLANKESALVVGTGDLSELALGFCTFAGDHIAMYNVNGGVPKTLVQRLIAWVCAHHASATEREILETVMATPVSPELVPVAADGTIVQRTEEIIGPYELHDFFLWALIRVGAGPRKTLLLARCAFPERDAAELERWLRVFIERFFANQFKRQSLPDGPKVGSVSLSPRADWRMPSDVSAGLWLRELD